LFKFLTNLGKPDGALLDICPRKPRLNVLKNAAEPLMKEFGDQPAEFSDQLMNTFMVQRR